MVWPGSDIIDTTAHPGARGHQGPEAGAILSPRSVVQVRQTQVMPELVSEDPYTTVFRHNGVISYPEIAVTDADAAIFIE